MSSSSQLVYYVGPTGECEDAILETSPVGLERQADVKFTRGEKLYVLPNVPYSEEHLFYTWHLRK